MTPPLSQQPEPVDPDAAGSDVAAPPRSLGLLMRERWDILAVIAMGGAAGSLARWAISRVWPHAADGFPWSTWLVNVVGAFLLGALTVVCAQVWPARRYLRPALGVGLLGGFTTFSAYVLDARNAYAAGSPAMALAGLLGTLVVALPAARLGLTVTRRLVGGRA